jgi:D-3-phosphoglycerate dehydrogenase
MYRITVCDTKTDRKAALGDAFGGNVRLTTATARTPSDVIAAASDADALVVDANTPVTRSVIEALDLTVIGRAGTGVDNVDIRAAADADVTVVHAPEYCIDEVSTNAVGLLLSGVRGLATYDRSTTRGEWDWEVGTPLHRLRGQTIGLLAFGDIARRTAEKLAGFDVDIVVHDPFVSADVFEEYGARGVSFDELVASADHLSIHAPLTDETRGLIDASVFERLPAHAIVVNHGRGEIIDEAALLSALDAGSIAGAGLDVLEAEPPVDPAILEHERTIVTPHSAWYSEESVDELVETVAGDVVRVLEGEAPHHPVDEQWA